MDVQMLLEYVYLEKIELSGAWKKLFRMAVSFLHKKLVYAMLHDITDDIATWRLSL
ncbi:6633_t:CDS:2 [Ambispora leptoticha]|uniref:6633_t:CDS:1 n=1 Tax=Ambispora leptoticha TaxID=144679 RepID=A0A9N8W067_9GLOM|nr:6633_t:CDS:2 [Ambispora leptoticha]